MLADPGPGFSTDACNRALGLAVSALKAGRAVVVVRDRPLDTVTLVEGQTK
jgi:hypothetical protein